MIAICITDYGFLLREGDGSVRVEKDRHVHGLFPRELHPGSYEMFIARRPDA